MFRIFIFTVLIYSFINACGGGFWPEDYEFKFLHKREFGFANISDDLNYSSTYNNLIYDYDEAVKKVNIKEWQKEFNNQFSQKEIEKFIYEKKDLSKIKNKEILKYIKFLDKQTPYVNRDSWYYYNYGYKNKKIKKSDIQGLIDESLQNASKVNSSYLKLRYFFLALRMAHYNNLKGLEIYEKYKYILEKSDKSIVKDWIQGLYAGILVKQADVAKGVYEFTKLFEEEKLNWYLAFYNFKYIKTDKQWEKLLSLAKDDNEKIKFFTLRALDSKANTIEELKNIAKINKNSKYYDLLLFREVLKSQGYFDIYPEYMGEKNYKSYKNFITYLKGVKKHDMYVIDLALSYFSFYEKNILESKRYLKEAYKLVKGDNIHELNALEYIIYLNGLNKIDRAVENEVAKRLDKLEKQPCNKQSIHKYTFHILKDLYKKQKDDFKYFLASNINYIEMNTINLSRYKKFKALESNKNKTALETYMLKNIKAKYNFDMNLKNTYFNILINNLNFKKALALNNKQLDRKTEFSLFNNYIYGNNRKGQISPYSLRETFKKIIKIKSNLKKNPNSVMDNYLYATVLYNLSYWGNSNSLTTVYRSNYFFKEKKLEEMKINLSIKHFEKALKYAKNKEFRAKITYMLAKSELAAYDLKNSKRIEYYEDDFYDFNRLTSWSDEEQKSYSGYRNDGYGKYFKQLMENYSDTKYYDGLIKECGRFNSFVSKNIK